MCYCDFDRPKVAHETVRTARKEYRCDECGRAIAKGELYENHRLLHEDSWSTYRWCLHCAVAQGIAADLADCHCWLYTQVWEDLREHAKDERNPALSRLVIAARRQWTYCRGPKKGRLVPIPVVHVTA